MDERTLDKHSVNCYFCNDLVDERDCLPADVYNSGDGGDICLKCQVAHDKKWDVKMERTETCIHYFKEVEAPTKEEAERLVAEGEWDRHDQSKCLHATENILSVEESEDV